MKTLRALCHAAGLLALLAVPALGAEAPRTVRVQFDKGHSSAERDGTIKGYEVVDYLLGARAGQSMHVSLTTRHGATYFNVLAPGEHEAALFTGSTSGDQYTGTLPASGDYTIRVYMMRAAARRNETAHYRLQVGVSGGPRRPAATNPHDARVAGTHFHATGQLRCATRAGMPMATCAFGVERLGNGDARVTVTLPGGARRLILFEHGLPAGYDARVGGHGAFGNRRQSDLNTVSIGEERYEIPDAVPLGG